MKYLTAAFFGLLFSFSCVAQEYIVSFNEGVKLFKAKEYAQSKAKVLLSLEGATGEADEAMQGKSNSLLAKIQYKLGSQAYKSKNYEESLDMHKQGAEYDATNALNMYGQGRALARMGKKEEAIAALDLVINSDSKKAAGAAKKVLKNIYYKEVNGLLKGTEADVAEAEAAISTLKEADKYGIVDENGHYYYALAYNKTSTYDEAIVHADKAISMSTASPDDKAKYYYAKGKALMALENKVEAKAALEQAKFGQYAENAQILINQL